MEKRNFVREWGTLRSKGVMQEEGALLDNSVVDRSGRQPYRTVPDVPSTNPA